MRDEQRYVRSGMRVILGAGTTIPVFRWVSDAVTVEPTVNKKRAILKLRAVC